MRTDHRALVRAALAAGCLATSVAARGAEWRTVLATSGLVDGGGLYGAAPLADGGAAFTLSAASGNWLVRIDARGHVVDRANVTRAGNVVELDGGALAVLDGEYESPDLPLVDVCHAERTARGPVVSRAVYEHDEDHGLAGFLAQSPNDRRGERDQPLHWFLRDCRASEGIDLGGRVVGAIVQDALGRGGWFDAFDRARSTSALLYADRRGVRWHAPLPPYASIVGGADGVHVVDGRYLGTGPVDTTTITRLDRHGREHWRRTLPRVFTVVSAPAGLLVSEDGLEGTLHYPKALRLLDYDGNERWRIPFAPQRTAYWPIRSAGDPGSVFLHLYDRQATGVLEVDARTGRATERVAPGRNARALAVLADGTVLTQRYFGDARIALWARGATEPVTVEDATDVPDVGTPQALVEGEDASYAVYGNGGGPHVARIDRDGRVAWTSALLPGGNVPQRTALSRDRFCVLRSTPSSGVRIECLDTATGAPAFPPRAFPAIAFSARLLTDGERIHLVTMRLVRSEAPFESQIVHRTLDRTGALVAERTSVVQGFASPFGAAPGGAYVVRDGDTLRFYTAAGEFRSTVAFAALGLDPARASIVAATDDGGALLADTGARPATIRVEARGEVRWRIASHPAAPTLRLGTDWLFSGQDEDGTVFARIDDRDGSTRWSRRERWVRGRLLWTAASDGSAFLVQSARAFDAYVTGASGGDLWWYDGATGRRVGALPGPRMDGDRFGGFAIHRFDRVGGLLTLRAEVDADRGRIVLDRRVPPSPVPNPSAPANRFAAGRWVGHGLPGQSLELAVDRTGRVDGRWLTFTGARGHAFELQRWFRLVGTASPGADRLMLSMQAPQPSPFEGAPSYRPAGTLAWRQHSCAEAEIDYRFEGGAMADIEGRMRLVRADAYDCERVRARPRPDSAVWATADGRGVVLHVGADGSATGAWTTHAPSASGGPGIPQWLELDVDAGGTVTITRTLGGAFEWYPTTNTWAIGSGRLERAACDRARLRYQFLDDELAEPFEGRRGELDLARVGGCQR